MVYSKRNRVQNTPVRDNFSTKKHSDEHGTRVVDQPGAAVTGRTKGIPLSTSCATVGLIQSFHVPLNLHFLALFSPNQDLSVHGDGHPDMR
jgi:hypothetical protein